MRGQHACPHVGTAGDGARLELLEPRSEGFLTRFLDARGEGPHHLTFVVPDLRTTVAQARALGLTVVGEDHDHPPWREAFIAPDRRHGVVIQLAQSDRSHPPVDRLLSSRTRDVGDFPAPGEPPSRCGGPDCGRPRQERSHGWTARIWRRRTLEFSRLVFGEPLGARVAEEDSALDLSWPGGSVRVHASDRPGVTGMSLRGGPADGIAIGPARLGAEAVHP
ncbi:VOC family protein [Microbispora sp. NEAU-D428]|uniref:VOC family protein n=1 Tax=Microbispora sitophila TaxID=2771537 RepID=UPI001865B957|nr:VOC family protein [Microbispora sitophila]MBE3009499.1 VOC family protein [Microbispora sitophila]